MSANPAGNRKAVAAPFIKIRKGLVSDPDVILIADATDLDEFAVVGRLSDIWDWVDSNSADGIGLTVSDKWLDRRVQCAGFAAAMRAVGWLDGDSGNLTFPRWDRHNSLTAKARALEAEAKRLRRADNTPPESSDDCPTVVGQSGDATVPGVSDQSKSKSKSKKITPHTPREAEPENLELDGLTPDARSPGGQPWNEAEAEFVAEWNKLPTGKRGVVPVYGLPPTMSVKDRDAFREAWRTKAEPARRAMAAIAAGAIQWDRSAMTIRAFFNSELDTILGGGHARHEQPVRRNPEAARGGRVDSSSDLDELLARSAKIQSDQRTAAGVGA
jgi:hypothetical protein